MDKKLNKAGFYDAYVTTSLCGYGLFCISFINQIHSSQKIKKKLHFEKVKIFFAE